MSVPDIVFFEKDSELPEDVLEILKGMKRGLRGQKDVFPVVIIRDRKKGLTAQIAYSSDIKTLEKFDSAEAKLSCRLLNLTAQRKS